MLRDSEGDGVSFIRQRRKSKEPGKPGGVGMGLAAAPVTNLVYYASVSKGTMIVAEYKDQNIDLATVALQCLEKVPAFHRRFTYTTKRKIFSCLMEMPFTYCAIVDEALTPNKAFVFLEQVRDEFKPMMHAQGMKQDGQGLEPCCFVDEFSTNFSRLVLPLVGVPQKEVDRIKEEEFLAQQNGEYDDDDDDDTYVESGPPEAFTSDHSGNLYYNHKQPEREQAPEKLSERRFRFPPLKGKRGKMDKGNVNDQVSEIKEIMMENSGKVLDRGQKLDVMVEGGSKPESAHHLQKSGSTRFHAHHVWWRNVKLVLIFDAFVCAILFAIWLGICRGFKCIK